MDYKKLKLSLSIELEAYEIYRDLLIENKYDIHTNDQEDEIINIKLILTNKLIDDKKRLLKDCESFDKTLIALLNYFQTSIEELSEKTNRRTIVEKRFIIYYFLSKRTELSLRSMVELFNQTNHSNAHHGKTVIQDLLDSNNKAMVKKINDIGFYLDYYNGKANKDKVSIEDNETFQKEPVLIEAIN